MTHASDQRGSLTAACRYVIKTGKDRFSRSGVPPISISGVEQNRNVYIIGLTRLALSGIDDPQLELGNSLERTGSNNPQRDGFDVVLANPPWGYACRSNRAGSFPGKNDRCYRPVHSTCIIPAPPWRSCRNCRPSGISVSPVVPNNVCAVICWNNIGLRPLLACRKPLFCLTRRFAPDCWSCAAMAPTKRVRMAEANPIFVSGKKQTTCSSS